MRELKISSDYRVIVVILCPQPKMQWLSFPSSSWLIHYWRWETQVIILQLQITDFYEENQIIIIDWCTGCTHFTKSMWHQKCVYLLWERTLSSSAERWCVKLQRFLVTNSVFPGFLVPLFAGDGEVCLSWMYCLLWCISSQIHRKKLNCGPYFRVVHGNFREGHPSLGKAFRSLSFSFTLCFPKWIGTESGIYFISLHLVLCKFPRSYCGEKNAFLRWGPALRKDVFIKQSIPSLHVPNSLTANKF